jgi:hypothetical protein
MSGYIAAGLVKRGNGDYLVSKRSACCFLYHCYWVNGWLKEEDIMAKLFYSGSVWLKSAALIITMIVSIVFSGCASTGANYGRLERNRDLEHTLLSYEVLPDHHYYTSGGYDKPNAILAIHNDYELVTDLWLSIPNVNSVQMRKWIDTIAPEQDFRRSKGYFAAYILDPAGNRVGFWYSIQDSTIIKFLGENKLQIYTPDLFQPGELFMGDGGEGIIKIR